MILNTLKWVVLWCGLLASILLLNAVAPEVSESIYIQF